MFSLGQAMRHVLDAADAVPAGAGVDDVARGVHELSDALMTGTREAVVSMRAGNAGNAVTSLTRSHDALVGGRAVLEDMLARAARAT